MADVKRSELRNRARWRAFRRFHEVSGQPNLVRSFLDWQQQLDPQRTDAWWADRWHQHFSAVSHWRRGRPVPADVEVFTDLYDLAGITMEEYFAPPADWRREGRPNRTIDPSEVNNRSQWRAFRRFHDTSGQPNLVWSFLRWQGSIHPERTFEWWAERWGVAYATVALCAQPFDQQFRRPKAHAAENALLFADLRELAGVYMAEYYAVTPASRSHRAGATRRKIGGKILPAVTRGKSRKVGRPSGK